MLSNKTSDEQSLCNKYKSLLKVTHMKCSGMGIWITINDKKKLTSLILIFLGIESKQTLIFFAWIKNSKNINGNKWFTCTAFRQLLSVHSDIIKEFLTLISTSCWEIFLAMSTDQL